MNAPKEIIDTYFQELLDQLELAYTFDKEIAIQSLIRRIQSLGGVQLESGEWVLGEENV